MASARKLLSAVAYCMTILGTHSSAERRLAVCTVLTPSPRFVANLSPLVSSAHLQIQIRIQNGFVARRSVRRTIENCPRLSIEVPPTAFSTETLYPYPDPNLDLWPWRSVPWELWSWPIHTRHGTGSLGRRVSGSSLWPGVRPGVFRFLIFEKCLHAKLTF